MKVLMINKFLYPNGGSESYMFGLGNYLQTIGHEVQYFGMEHEGRCVGNNVDAYTSGMDFHKQSLSAKLSYSVKTIYSREAREKIRLVLDDFKPDICHLNNFNYQLTPSIILEIVKWRKENNHKCKIIFTAHDFQLLCPNHMLRDIRKNQNCEKCLGGHFGSCTKNKCIHGSLLKSCIGTIEAEYWKRKKVYACIDQVICCSAFMKQKMDSNPIFSGKTITMHNFIDYAKINLQPKETDKKDGPKYVLYFGRYSKEKGIETLLEASRRLPDINFVFAGNGPLEEKVDAAAEQSVFSEVNPVTGNHSNVVNKGFLTGNALTEVITNAQFLIYPSEWYENCPLSVMESQAYGTPVLGADIGGIPELIVTPLKDSEHATGELFESGNVQMLVKSIQNLYNDNEARRKYAINCHFAGFDSVEEYTKKMMEIYKK